MKVIKTIAEDMRMTFYDLFYKITKIRALIGDWRVCMRICNHGCDVNCLESSQPLSCLYEAMQTGKTFSIG